VISTPIDFLGVNYYNRWIVRAKADNTGVFAPANLEYVTDVPSATFTTMGWEVYPHGLNLLLEELSRTYRPGCLLITENGAAFEDSWNGNGRISDPQRIVYLAKVSEGMCPSLGWESAPPVSLIWQPVPCDGIDGRGQSERYFLCRE
jgi:beta-glucosidase